MMRMQVTVFETETTVPYSAVNYILLYVC